MITFLNNPAGEDDNLGFETDWSLQPLAVVGDDSYDDSDSNGDDDNDGGDEDNDDNDDDDEEKENNYDDDHDDLNEDDRGGGNDGYGSCGDSDSCSRSDVPISVVCNCFDFKRWKISNGEKMTGFIFCASISWAVARIKVLNL